MSRSEAFSPAPLLRPASQGSAHFGGATGATGGSSTIENAGQGGPVSGASAGGSEQIRRLDPAMRGGFKVVYDREIPVEIRVQEGDEAPQEVGSLEALRAKVLCKPDGRGSIQMVRVQLSSETDLFFHYLHECQAKDFQEIREEQELMVEFDDYPGVLAKSFADSVREPHSSYLAVFVMDREGHARLDFIQNMEYKFIELLSLNFERSSDETIREHIVYKYNALKSRLALVENQYHEVVQAVRSKNPSLAQALPRVPSSPNGESSHDHKGNQNQHQLSAGTNDYLGVSKNHY